MFSNRNCFLVLVFLLLIYVENYIRADNGQSSIVVNTESGPIRGYSVNTLLDQRPYYSFRGIPFAETPIDDLRFKAPERIAAWNDILEAKEYGNICVQLTHGIETVVGDENCLFLNVFTPDVAPSEKMAVVFYIHGGAYNEGGTKWVNPDILLDENIVLVTVQYRLGLFGFLALDDSKYSGNQGMKDQLMALEWTTQNIHHFGGDKNQITLWGHSAGGSSVSLLTLVPQAKGLFRRAIMTGGSAANKFAYLGNRGEQKIKLRRTLAKLLDKNEDDLNEKQIIDWLLSSNSSDIQKLLFVQMDTNSSEEGETILLWAPVVERNDAVRPFLLQSPGDLYSHTSDIDVLIGYSTDECIFFSGKVMANPELLKPFNKRFNIKSPLAGMNTNKTSEDYPNYIREIRQFYFGDKEVDGSTLNEYTQMMSDVGFTYGIYTTAIKQAKRSTGRTYYFEFDVDAGFNYFRQLANASALRVRGAAHIEDLPYLFKTPLLPEEYYTNLKPDSDEVRIIHMLRTFFINFVRFGIPTPSGQPVQLETFNENAQNYVTLSNDGLVLGVNPHEDAFRFWSQLLQKYDSIIYKNTP